MSLMKLSSLRCTKQGRDWGGDWKSFFDPAHVEYKHNLSMKQLRALPKDTNGFLIKLP
jgi:hypothetical protein